jgi:serine/threonine-protein kinase RsbW
VIVETELLRRVPAEPRQVTLLRRELTGWLSLSGVPEDECAEWALVTAELASNAVENSPAGTEVLLAATCSPERITLKVTNTSDGHHVPRIVPHDGPYVEHGRGLKIVLALTDRLVFEVSGEDVVATCWRQRSPVPLSG